MAEEPTFAPIASHPSQTATRVNVPVLLHEKPVTEPALLVKILSNHVSAPEKRLVLVCESFDAEVLPHLLEKFEERLNLIIVECPKFGQGNVDALRELASLLDAPILADASPDACEGSPLGEADKVEVAANNVVTFSHGDGVVVISDCNEVMVVHATEDDEENEEERLARLACEESGS